jgi:hypothetical protein
LRHAAFGVGGFLPGVESLPARQAAQNTLRTLVMLPKLFIRTTNLWPRFQAV